MLTQQLRELESDGLVHRTIYTQVPPKVKYSLTDWGRGLMPIIDILAEWGENHLAEIGKEIVTQAVGRRVK